MMYWQSIILALLPRWPIAWRLLQPKLCMWFEVQATRTTSANVLAIWFETELHTIRVNLNCNCNCNWMSEINHKNQNRSWNKAYFAASKRNSFILAVFNVERIVVISTIVLIDKSISFYNFSQQINMITNNCLLFL